MQIRFDTYYTNDELEERLRWLAQRYPDLCDLRVLGRSYEGRPIHLVVLTHKDTGADRDKPAFWVDGNIHATEVTGAMAALYLIRRLLEGYGRDARITRLLDEQTFYVVPRLNPDGAALALSARPRFLRSGTRPYPWAEPEAGLHAEDIDGDGRILQMRIEDPAGTWKVSERDPRLLVRRGIDEEGGIYYRLFPEGRVEDWDGWIIRTAPPLEGLDFNRNFPGSWRPEGDQRGAGDFPGSEPEIRAVLEFMAEHRNIFGAITFHTFSRAILRPFGTRDDKEMEADDLRVYEEIGERGTELTGYPCVSVYHHFKYHPKEVITGVFDDWIYDHKGVFSFTVELWDLPSAAGVEWKNREKKFIEWFRKHPVEDDYRILDFVQRNAPDALVEWYRFDHPQLGRVELGGWNAMYSWRNPPPQLLEKEIAPQADFAISFASLAPRIAWRAVEVTPIDEEHVRLLAVVENVGFLPTDVSRQARKRKAVRKPRFELELPESVEIVTGRRRLEFEPLEGRSNKLSCFSIWSDSSTDNRIKAEWVLRRRDPDAAVVLLVITERAGVLRREIPLGAG
ncbi:MAG: carboxypeptidase [Planctomycetota bacterium]|nr:MAG: carboxypeptidase [Planctomycetota bacterium]